MVFVPLSQILKTTLPVALGYLPLGATFGVLLSNLGVAWYWATLMGIFIYAGAAQFMAVGLLAAHAGLFEVFISTLVLNSRHIFYGLSLFKQFPKKGLLRTYLIFALTDETYSLLTTAKPGQPPSFYVWVSGLNHLYWVVGCTLGGILGAAFKLNIPGLDFALTALFIVLSIEQYARRPQWNFLVIAFVVGIGARLVTPHYLLLLSISVCCVIVLWLYAHQNRSKKVIS